MRRSSVVLITGLLPLFLGLTLQAHAEAGDGGSLAGIDVIGPDTVDPETGLRVAHLKVQVGADRYIDAEGLARFYGTDITSIRERNLGTTLARCRQSDGSLVRRTRHLKEPPPVTRDEVIAMRSANGLWTNCASDPKQQTLVLIQGEKLDVPRAPTAVPISVRLSCYDRMIKCDTDECRREVATSCGARVSPEQNVLKESDDDRKAREQREADAAKEKAKIEAERDAYRQEMLKAQRALAAKNALRTQADTKRSTTARFWLILGMLGILGVAAIIRRFWLTYQQKSDILEDKWRKHYEGIDTERQRAATSELKARDLTISDKDQEIALRDGRIQTLEREREEIIRNGEREIRSVFEKLLAQENLTIDQGVIIEGLRHDLVVKDNQVGGLERELDLKNQEANELTTQLRTKNAEIEQLNASLDGVHLNGLELSRQMEELREEHATQAAMLLAANTRVNELLDQIVKDAETHRMQIAELETALRESTERETALQGVLTEYSDTIAEQTAEIERLDQPVTAIKEHDLGTPNAEFREQILLMVASILGEPYRMITGKEFPVLSLESNTGLDLAERVDEMSHAMKTGAEAYRLRAQHDVAAGLVGLGMVIDGNPLIEVDGEFNCEARMGQLRKALVRVVDRINAMLRRSNPPPGPIPSPVPGEAEEELRVDDSGECDEQTARVNQSLTHLIEALEERVQDLKRPQPDYEDDQAAPPQTLKGLVPAQTGQTRRPTPVGLGAPNALDLRTPEHISAFTGLMTFNNYVNSRIPIPLENEEDLRQLVRLSTIAAKRVFRCLDTRFTPAEFTIAELATNADFRKRLVREREDGAVHA